MRRPALAALAVALALSAPAASARAAPPGMTEPAPPPERPRGARKDPGTATLLAVAGTVAPAILAYAAAELLHDRNEEAAESLSLFLGIGAMVGPSLGHWYAGNFFTRGMALRLVGSGSLLIGFSIAIGCIFEEDEGCGQTAPLFMLGGAGLWVGGTIHDLATADNEARAWNRDHGHDTAVAPTVIDGKPGLVLATRF